jgi:ubiquinone/menaquinone biosynthesis C-methylase UbiE
MERKLEKEVMDDKDQVLAYANADFSSSNNLLIDEISNNDLSKLNRILDLGCGPAAIPIGLADKFNRLHIMAVDASEEMLEIASENIQLRNLNTRINLVHGAIPNLKEAFKDQRFDIIISKDLLHHLPDPLVFWEEIKSLSGKGTLIYVMDLIRPEQESEAEKMVQMVSGNEAEVLKEDFYNSLLAAFTITEIKQQLKTTGLDFEVGEFGTRHFLVKGIFNGV